IGCFTFDEMLTAAQNHWSVDHTEADFPLCAISFLQDLTIYKSSEEVNKSIILPSGNSTENTPKPMTDTSNISELINRFENLALTHLESRPPITCRNCRQLGHYT